MEERNREKETAERRQALRSLRGEGTNIQALVIAAIPIILLVAVLIVGVLLVRSRRSAAAVAPTATHLPTVPPPTLVPAKRTVVPTVVQSASQAAPAQATAPAPTTATMAEFPSATASLQPTEEPTAIPTPEQGLFPGVQAQVSGTAGRGLRLRSGPGLNQPTLKVMPEGTTVQILAGPTEADGYQWYQIRDDAGTEGWAAGDWLVRTK
jgi:uncharacterized protein YgiM (DUF1202 family)